MTARLPCCVPFCRRTTAREKLPDGHNEWICQKHWRCVPATLKARKRKAARLVERAHRRFEGAYQRQGGFAELQLGRVTAAEALELSIWRRCKDAAMGAAVEL